MTDSKPKLIPVINHEARNFQLAAYVRKVVTDDDRERQSKIDTARGGPVVVPAETECQTMLPGLNYMDCDFLERAGFNPNSCNVQCEIADPTSLAPFRAEALVEKTASKSALVLWRTAEARPKIVAVLDARLSKLATRAA